MFKVRKFSSIFTIMPIADNDHFEGMTLKTLTGIEEIAIRNALYF